MSRSCWFKQVSKLCTILELRYRVVLRFVLLDSITCILSYVNGISWSHRVSDWCRDSLASLFDNKRCKQILIANFYSLVVLMNFALCSTHSTQICCYSLHTKLVLRCQLLHPKFGFFKSATLLPELCLQRPHGALELRFLSHSQLSASYTQRAYVPLPAIPSGAR